MSIFELNVLRILGSKGLMKLLFIFFGLKLESLEYMIKVFFLLIGRYRNGM